MSNLTLQQIKEHGRRVGKKFANKADPTLMRSLQDVLYDILKTPNLASLKYNEESARFDSTPAVAAHIADLARRTGLSDAELEKLVSGEGPQEEDGLTWKKIKAWDAAIKKDETIDKEEATGALQLIKEWIKEAMTVLAEKGDEQLQKTMTTAWAKKVESKKALHTVLKAFLEGVHTEAAFGVLEYELFNKNAGSDEGRSSSEDSVDAPPPVTHARANNSFGASKAVRMGGQEREILQQLDEARTKSDAMAIVIAQAQQQFGADIDDLRCSADAHQLLRDLNFIRARRGQVPEEAEAMISDAWRNWRVTQIVTEVFQRMVGLVQGEEGSSAFAQFLNKEEIVNGRQLPHTIVGGLSRQDWQAADKFRSAFLDINAVALELKWRTLRLGQVTEGQLRRLERGVLLAVKGIHSCAVSRPNSDIGRGSEALFSKVNADQALENQAEETGKYSRLYQEASAKAGAHQPPVQQHRPVSFQNEAPLHGVRGRGFGGDRGGMRGGARGGGAAAGRGGYQAPGAGRGGEQRGREFRTAAELKNAPLHQAFRDVPHNARWGKCRNCGEGHTLFNCPEVARLPNNDRIEIAQHYAGLAAALPRG